MFERGDIHVALERVVRVHVQRLGARQVYGFTTEKFDIRTRRVEMGVVGNNGVRFDRDAEQDALRRPTLVRRDDLLESKDIHDRVTESIPATGAGVGLIATHDAGPGFRRHRAGPRVGQQIDNHVLGA